MRMISIGRLAKAAGFSGGTMLLLLAITGSNWPAPLPSISPALPVPSPSVPTVQSLLNPSSGGQPSGGGPVTSPAHQGPAGSTPASAGPGVAAGTFAAGPAAPEADRTTTATLVQAAQAGAVRHAPIAGALPRLGGPGGQPPIAPAALAGLLLLLFLCGLRLGPRPAAGRRFRFRVEFGGGGAPDGAAAAAVRCLLESALPRGTRVRRQGGDAFRVDAPLLFRAVVSSRLAEVAARARRVGLHVEWSADTSAAREGARVAPPRLALG